MTAPGPGFSPRARAAVPLALAVAVATSFVLAQGPPRLLMRNAAIEVDRPWSQVLPLCTAALLLAASACLARAGFGRGLLAGGALVVAALAADGALARVRLDDQRITTRGLFGTAGLDWTEVTHLDQGSAAIVLSGAGERHVRLRTSGYTGDQRATLERAIARRVRAASPAAPPTAGR